MQSIQAEAEYVRARTLAARFDSGESTIWRMVKDGLLPQPTVRIGRRTTLWRWSDVEKFLAAKADGGLP